jgi:hypothetical protein
MFAKLHLAKNSLKRFKVGQLFAIPLFIAALWILGIFSSSDVVPYGSEEQFLAAPDIPVDPSLLAFVTLITAQTNYDSEFYAALTLGKSIMKKRDGENPLILLHTTASLSEKQLCMLQAVGWVIIANEQTPREVTPIQAKHMKRDDGTYSLLHIFNLVEYEAIVYLSYESLVISSTFNIFEFVLPYKESPAMTTIAA